MTESESQLLCKSCGLCCSGHLFAWVRLNAPELDSAQSLGLNVIRDDPRQRGFTQPCPLWDGMCTVYTSPSYPRTCKTYKCIVLRRLLDEDIALPEALSTIQETLGLIREIEPLLPASTSISFRERLIAHKEFLESKGTKQDVFGYEFLGKAELLLTYYEDRFGVDDFIDYEK
ncbi:MAG: hypothetical protein HOP27_07095 [Anaerolineales bacterium]|nr:hypothetical protein [Anaerolineales bacterium]